MPAFADMSVRIDRAARHRIPAIIEPFTSDRPFPAPQPPVLCGLVSQPWFWAGNDGFQPQPAANSCQPDRKTAVEEKSVQVSVVLGVRRTITKKQYKINECTRREE